MRNVHQPHACSIDVLALMLCRGLNFGDFAIGGMENLMNTLMEQYQPRNQPTSQGIRNSLPRRQAMLGILNSRLVPCQNSSLRKLLFEDSMPVMLQTPKAYLGCRGISLKHNQVVNIPDHRHIEVRNALASALEGAHLQPSLPFA